MSICLKIYYTPDIVRIILNLLIAYLELFSLLLHNTLLKMRNSPKQA